MKNIALTKEIWTSKHDGFCLENQIPPSARLLWQWLLREGVAGEKIEPELTEFNEWVKTYRKPYCHKTLKLAIAKLEEAGVVFVERKFCWKTYRLIVRPLDWLKPKRRNFHLGKKGSGKGFGSPKKTDDPIKQQQHSIEVDQVVSESGIVFTPKGLLRVVKYSIEQIRKAIALFHFRGGAEKINNPSGWLIECLRGEWWLDQEVYVS